MNTKTIADVEHHPPDLFVTSAALQPWQGAPNLHAEVAALCELSKALAGDPCHGVRYLLDISRRLCSAGTAGLSLLRDDPDGHPIMRWEAISGALVHYEGTEAPRAGSPCGLCLDAGTTILVSRPERVFKYLRAARPAMIESLIAPLCDNTEKALGTFWIAHHEGTSHFSSGDARIAEQLAAQLVLALKLLEHARERQHALTLLASHQAAQQALLVHELYRERSLREQAESESQRALAFKDAMIHEVNHRTKNSLQAAATLLSLHARATASPEVRQALLDSRGRLQLLAKVHQLLDSSSDGTQSVLMPRLLEALGDALRQAFANTAVPVRLALTSDPITLHVEEAIPIALLANEAVTNAYKHAFPNGSAGEITVQLRWTPESALTLRIADTGVGLHFSGAEGGIGLQLMRILAAQLHGALDFAGQADAAGTVITLTIPRPGAAKTAAAPLITEQSCPALARDRLS